VLQAIAITIDVSAPANGLDALLRALGGANAYLMLRARLVACLRRRGAASPDDLADEALDRVERRLACGEPVRDPGRYALGVARLVAMEASRRWRREHGAAEVEDVATVAVSADDDRERAAALEAIDAADRVLLARYGEVEGRGRGAARRALAADLGIGVNALRIRVHRMRKRVREALNAARPG
jgi:DNA-directed RNA polymerase specialized sigma24 family protein